MKVRHPVLKTFQAYFLWMTLQCRKHWSSFQFLLRVSPKRYIFLPIIIYFGRKTKETGVTFYYLIYFPLKFDLFIVFIILFMQFLIFCWTIHHFGRGIQHNRQEYPNSHSLFSQRKQMAYQRKLSYCYMAFHWYSQASRINPSACINSLP